MAIRNPAIDEYLSRGCGRCDLYDTPECKAIRRRPELEALREVALEAGLTEELKWKVPTYTWNGRNVAIVSAFRDYSAVSFFKRTLMPDPEGFLHSPGENSQAARLLKYTSVAEVKKGAKVLRAFLQAAIDIEMSGKKVNFRKEPDPVPEELSDAFRSHPGLQDAFESLTPGRQRSYIIYISGAKQTQTRQDRVARAIPVIFAGRGWNEYS